MDADTRHQLKQNELLDALNRLRRLSDTRVLYTLLAIAVVILIVLAWMGWTARRQYAREQNWQRLNTAIETVATGQLADDGARIAGGQSQLRSIISEVPDPEITGWARLTLASTEMDEALSVAEENREPLLRQAIESLEKVTANPESSPMLKAAATFALANAHESLREFGRAQELYEELVNNAAYNGSPYKQLARSFLGNLDEVREPIAFKPGMPPESERGTAGRLPSGLDRATLEQLRSRFQARTTPPEEQTPTEEGSVPPLLRRPGSAPQPPGEPEKATPAAERPGSTPPEPARTEEKPDSASPQVDPDRAPSADEAPFGAEESGSNTQSP
jgi:tetratricopeptide (TPR) repeat protein